MTPQDLDPSLVFGFLVFLAAFAAGQELSQMTPRNLRPPYYDRKVALSILAIMLIVLLLAYLFGTPDLPAD